MAKNVVIEYERKFLVKKIPNYISLNKNSCIEIEQIYLSGVKDALCTRIRKETKSNFSSNISESKYYMMMKHGGLKSHLEWTKEITSNEYYDLFKFKSDSLTISKTRYRIPSELNPNIIIELDVFHEHLNGLMIAEVEDTAGNTTIIDNYKPESWFDIEVTNDPHFYNVSLAYKLKKPHRNFFLNFCEKVKLFFHFKI
jgi:CYTH domain-containing protein